MAETFVRLGLGERLSFASERFVLNTLPDRSVACTEWGDILTVADVGYDPLGTVSLEDEVLVIESTGCSYDGHGPTYL